MDWRPNPVVLYLNPISTNDIFSTTTYTRFHYTQLRGIFQHAIYLTTNYDWNPTSDINTTLSQANTSRHLVPTKRIIASDNYITVSQETISHHFHKRRTCDTLDDISRTICQILSNYKRRIMSPRNRRINTNTILVKYWTFQRQTGYSRRMIGPTKSCYVRTRYQRKTSFE